MESDATSPAYQDEYVPTWRTRLPERAYLIGLQTSDSAWTSDDLPHWAEGLQALKDLCGRVGGRTSVEKNDSIRSDSLAKSPGHKPLSLDGVDIVPSEHGGFPSRCLPTQCICCLGDDRLVDERRKKQWVPTHVFWRHVRTQYLKGRNSNDRWRCPHRICQNQQVTLDNKAHFLDHAQIEHNVRLQKTV